MYVVRKMHAGLPKRRGNPKDDFRNAQLYKNKIEKLKPIIMQQYEYTNKIYYDHFVLPFTIGLVVLLGYLCVRYYKWIKSFPKEERKKIRKGLFSFKTIRSGWEIFRESLLHHNIFKTNPMLGYMHMTFAFGWFLLIVVGKIDLWFIIPVLSTHLISLSFSVISIRQKRHSRTASFSRS